MKKIKLFILGVVTIALCSVFFQSNKTNLIVMSNVEAITSGEQSHGSFGKMDMYFHDWINKENNTFNDRPYEYYWKNGEIVYHQQNGTPLCGYIGYTTANYDKDENGNILQCWGPYHI